MLSFRSASGAVLSILIAFFLIPLCASAQPSINDASNIVPLVPEDICPLLVGESIPTGLTLSTPEGDQFSLDTAVAQQPTLLLFYRGSWCPYCNRHLAELRTIENELRELGFRIIAISADRPSELREGKETAETAYTLLSDSSVAAAKAFGLAFRVDDKTVERYRGMNIDLENASGRDHHMLPVPAAFLIDTSGVIVFEYINPNYRVRVDAQVLLAAAQSMIRKKQ